MANKRSSRKGKRDIDGLGQLIAKECACWRGGQCLGAAVDRRFCVPLPKCLVLLGERCVYFETCVLPMSLKDRKYHGVWERYQQMTVPDAESTLEELTEEEQAAYKEHPFVGNRAPATAEPERFCECGEPLETRKQLCSQCRSQRPEDRSGVEKEQKLEKAG